MRIPVRSLVWRYGLAIIVVLVALLAQWLLHPWLPFAVTPMLFFIPMVMLAAWWGGLGPGLLATALAAWFGGFTTLATDTLLFNHPHENYPLIIFILVGVLISILAERRLRNERSLRAERDRLVSLLDQAREADGDCAQREAILASMTEGLIIADLQGQVLSMNPAALRLHGLARVEDCRRPLAAYSDLLEVRDLTGRLLPVEEWPLGRVLRGEEFTGAEIQVRRMDTGLYWIGSYNGVVVRDGQGQPILAVVTLRDVTGQREAERERHHLLDRLETEQARLKAMIECAPIGIIMADEEARILLANPAAQALYGRPAPYCEDYETHAVLGICHPDGAPYAPRDLPLTRAALDGETQRNFELLISASDGASRMIQGNSAPIRDGQGRICGAIALFNDITEAKQIERERQDLLCQVQEFTRELGQANIALESQRAQLEAMIHHMPVGVLIAEAPTGRIMLGNAAMERILGHPLDPIGGFDEYGQLPFYHLDGAPYPLGEYPLARTIVTGEVIDGETLRIARGEGDWATLRISAAPLRDLAGRIIAGMIAAHDITELQRLQEELKQRADELSQINLAKDEFLAMLAHELRNPLAPILSALHIMQTRNRQIDPIQRRSIEMIERQIQHMARLVDDLLDVSRITRGRIELRREVLDFSIIAGVAIESCRAAIDSQQQDLEVSLPPAPVWVEADPARLEQIITNLLNNAAKYTRAGGRIWLTVTPLDDEVELRVRDNGIGIPADMLVRIFDLFSQVERSLDRSQGGLGIGLTLVHRLVALHDGRIEAVSEGVGHGSEFIMHLPLARPELTPAAISDTTDEDLADRRLRILVVEDNTDTALAMGEVLELWGHEVRVAYDGPGAVEIAMAYQPEVILLDIGLPVMDGYQVARALRAQPSFGSTLMVAITGYGQADDQRRSREAGIDQHFTKPIDLSRLKDLLADFVLQGGQR